jgi:cytochrome b6
VLKGLTQTREFQQVFQWLDSRFQLAPLMAFAAKKKVPIHRHSVWYYMGGIALMLIGVQVLTGILLSIYYIPELSSANASILKLTTKVEFGWFIRSLHSWAANLLIAVVFVHMFSAYFMKAYRPPREITWWSGLALLGLMMAFGFTGYLLPWDEVAFFATKIGLDIASKTPLVGEWLANVLRGGPQIGQATLSRFFTIHVFLLPLGLMAFMGGHLWLVQTQGMSEPKHFKALPEKEKTYEPFFPTFVLKDAMVWLLFFNLLAACATLAPWSVGKEADPFAPAPVGIKPEWYFLAMFQFLKLLPPMVGPIEGEMLGMGFFALIGLILASVPLWDGANAPPGRSLWASRFGFVVLLGFITFTVWGMLS